MATSFTRNGKSEGGTCKATTTENRSLLPPCYYVRRLLPNGVVTLRKLRQLLTSKVEQNLSQVD